MSVETGKFTVSYPDLDMPTVGFNAEGIFIGRLDTCEIVLDHQTVSRIHAGITLRDKRYFLNNLSSSNIVTLNGRLLGPKKTDALADGDTIQIGPFTIAVGLLKDEILLVVESQVARLKVDPTPKPVPVADNASIADGVLDVFWEKRTREKEDWGTRLRPTEKPIPGKAMFNWRPTRDLRGVWRGGLFVWAILLIGAVGAFAYFRYPGVYAPESLASPHVAVIESSGIASTSNSNSCTTCHAPNEPMENACIRCHQATEFHVSNTKAHQDAGITCTVCHKEHQGADFDMNATAIQSCAECHNDNNTKTYNGKAVRTAHGGTYGYPITNGEWKWKGVYKEVADAIPEISKPAIGDKNEQAKLSRHFHTIHLARLKSPSGLIGDKNGLVTCSTCHGEKFDVKNLDRETPRQTCAVCHSTTTGTAVQDARFGSSPANCISCHVQHAYSGGRWKEFLTDDALKRRVDSVKAKIETLKAQ
jgi:pSer/pThr/pTyr-binding forkhead associated (FHA) protein